MKKVFAILLAFVLIFSLCSCGEKSQAKEEPTAYFPFTVSWFTNVFENEYGINLTPIRTIDTDDGGKISTYTCNTEIEYNYVHYSVSHDAATNKVSFISFDFDKSKRDMTGNLTLYYIHIGVIAEIINPAVDLDALYEAIINVNGENEGADEMAIYQTDEFNILATCYGDYFSASFVPPSANN